MVKTKPVFVRGMDIYFLRRCYISGHYKHNNKTYHLSDNKEKTVMGRFLMVHSCIEQSVPTAIVELLTGEIVSCVFNNVTFIK